MIPVYFDRKLCYNIFRIVGSLASSRYQPLKIMKEKKNLPKNTIGDMPPEERPYEKCLQDGPEALSDRQLLAVILRSGVPGSSAVDLAGSVL